MRLVRGLYNIKEKDEGCVLAIGNFDGVHLGHQALLLELRKLAKKLHTSSMVMTFEPHAAEYFALKACLPRLSRWQEKFDRLCHLEIDRFLILSFNKRFSNLTAEDFIETILYQKLKIKGLVIGDDFRFGRDRKGNLQMLQEAASCYGWEILSIPTLKIGGLRVSSTRIREALGKDQLDLAKSLLGYPYYMMGRVVHGDKRGRILGFPTANINLHRQESPLKGIYAVRVHGIGKKTLLGAASLGIRPTIGGTKALLEVHLFDFNQMIYGRRVSVEFCKKIREEMAFSDLQLLIEKIKEDIQVAREYFKRGEVNDRL